ncbi:MAG: hypothetical protein ACRELC_09550 [Gemmatimonadota bacterium]
MAPSRHVDKLQRRVGTCQRASDAGQAGTPRQTYFRRGLGLKQQIQPQLVTEYGSALVGLVRENGYELDVGRLRFRLAKSFGFCYGVDRAVEYAYESREKFPDRGSSSSARSSTTRT